MDRKIEVGDEYDFRGTVVDTCDDGWPVITFRDGRQSGVRRIVSPDVIAHATLVKAAERPLAVGDKAMWLESRARVEIIDIFERKSTKFAVVEALNRPSWEQPFDVVRLDELRRAETP